MKPTGQSRSQNKPGLTLKALLAKRIPRRASGLPCKLRQSRYPHILDKRANRILGLLLECQNWSSETERALDGFKIRLGWRVVWQVLKSLSHVPVAVGFFTWAGRQKGYKHNTKTYAVIVRLVGDAGDFKLMHTFLLQMHQDRCVLTPFFFADIIMAYGRSNMVKEAYLVFKHMRDAGCHPNRFVYNCLISVLTRAGYLEGAKLVYEKMWNIKGCQPDKVTYNMLIDNYGKSGDVLEAQRYLLDMKQKDTPPNEKSYTSLIGSLHRAGKLQKAHEVFHEVKSKGSLVNRVTYTELIRGFGKAGKVEEALKLFSEMEEAGCPSDVVVHNILIDALVKHGSTTEAVEFLSAMQGKGCRPNVVTFNSLIRGFCKARKMDEAYEWYENMRQQGVVPDDHTYSILINGYCETGQWEVGYKFLMKTEDIFNSDKDISNGDGGIQAERSEAILTKSVFVHNVMLDGLVKARNLEAACAHFKVMQEKGCNPDVFSYSIIIHGLGSAGKTTDALHMYKNMKSSGLKPNLVTCNTLINILGKVGRAFEVREIMNEMSTLGLKPDIITYTSLVATVGSDSGGLRRRENSALKCRFDHILGIKNINE